MNPTPVFAVSESVGPVPMVRARGDAVGAALTDAAPRFVLDLAWRDGKPDSLTLRAKGAIRTRLVHGGTRRSGYGEMSEAIFLTSGYAYDCAGDAAARFAGEQQGMTYSRLQNPTVEMLEHRIALLEGAEACRTMASGMAAMTAASREAASTFRELGDRPASGRSAASSSGWPASRPTCGSDPTTATTASSSRARRSES